MVMSVVQAASKGLVLIHGLLQLRAMFVVCAVTRKPVGPMSHAPADYEEQGVYFCCDTGDSRYTVVREGHRRLLQQALSSPPHPLKKK